jgi:anti-repressor protein
MDDIQTFKNEEFGEVRTLVVNSEPWFVGSNVATILGYTNPQKAIRDHVDDDDKLTERIVLSGQNREVVIINESGLYSLILSSKLPTAKKFKRWVTSEVLPAIRKSGGYMVAKEEETPEQLMARALRVAEETLARQKAKMEQVQRENKRLNADNEQKEGEINILRPDAEYTRKTLTSVSTWNTNIIAKEMGMSAVTLNKKLQKLGVQYKQHDVWVISAKYEDKGYVKTQTYTYMKSGGETGTRLQMEWTERGRRFLHELHDNGRI